MKTSDAAARSHWRPALDAIMGVAIALNVLALLISAGRIHAGWVTLGVALNLLTGALWALLRRTPYNRVWLVLLALVTLGITALPAAGNGSLPMVLLVVVLTVVLGTARWAVGLSVALAVLIAALSATYGSGLLDALWQGGAVFLFLLCGVGYGVLIRSSDDARDRAERLTAQLQVANERLRDSHAVERDLLLAKERTRSARELHDGLGHRLTLARMSLEYAERMRSRDPDRAWAEVGRAAGMTQEALDEMRTWVRALHPPVLSPDLTGVDALDAIADSFRGTGLSVEVTHHGVAEPLPPAVSLFATRMVQECLTNSLRHGSGQRVQVALTQSPHQLRIVVRDDGTDTMAGRGGATQITEGFGLRSLRERAEALAGAVRAGHRPDGGFEVTATVRLDGPKGG